MFKTKIRKEGISAVITLSSEMLAVLGVEEGDTVYVTWSDDNSLKIHAHDPVVIRALDEAEMVIDENCTLLQELSLR